LEKEELENLLVNMEFDSFTLSVFGDVLFDPFTPLHRPLQDRTYSLVGSYSC